MTIDKSIKIGIITSLIGSVIFLYLLDPILKILSDLFFYLSSKISNYFIDKLYVEIAVGKTDYALTLMTILIVLFTSIATLSIMRKVTKHNQFLEEKIDEKENVCETEEKNKTLILLRKTLPILFIIFINVVMVLQLVSSHIKVSSINTFDQRIRILAPYIKPIEKQLFISRFSSMRTYDEYLGIIMDIENIAGKNKIYLPEQQYTYTY